jgi:hypothetical protein
LRLGIQATRDRHVHDAAHEIGCLLALPAWAPASSSGRFKQALQRR